VHDNRPLATEKEGEYVQTKKKFAVIKGLGEGGWVVGGLERNKKRTQIQFRI
jgi:hypothetical protein